MSSDDIKSSDKSQRAHNFNDLTGKRFGKLTVKELSGKNKNRRCLWLCLCDCGKEKVILGNQLTNKFTKSCGCLKSPSEGDCLKNLKFRLEKYSKLNEKTGCIEWIVNNRCEKSGCGLINFRSKQMRTNRASWIAHNGPIPNCMLVCHKCDNQKCINPEHLFLGTQKDNMQDMISKGRRVKNALQGELHEHKISQKDVLLSRIIHKKSIKPSKIYMVIKPCISKNNFYKILSNKYTWKHLTVEDENRFYEENKSMVDDLLLKFMVN
jgi:hypothetical protein